MSRLTEQLNRTRYADAKIALQAGDLNRAAAAFARHFAKPSNRNDPALASKYGQVLLRLERFDDSLVAFQRALALDPDNPEFNYRVGFLLERQKDHQTAREHYSRAIVGDPRNPEYLYRRARVNNTLGDKSEAIADAESAIAINSKDSRYHQLLRGASYVLPLWRQIEILEAGLEMHQDDASWLRSLARATFKMRRWQQTLNITGALISTKRADWKDAVYAAAAAHETDDPDYEAYVSLAVELAPRDKTQIGGAARLFETVGLRDLAILNYTAQLRKNPASRLYYLRGLNLARQHRWVEASSDFRVAVGLSPSNNDYHYRLGLSLERQNAFAEAAEAYRASITSTSVADYRRYRAVSCYSRAGRFMDAIDLIIGTAGDFDLARADSASDREPTDSANDARFGYLRNQAEHAAAQLFTCCDPQSLNQLAENFAELAEGEMAMEFFHRAIRCSINHPTTIYLKAAQVAIRFEWYDEAEQLFLQSRIFRRASSVDRSKILATPESRRVAKFVEFSEVWPLDDQTALFEPNHGTTLSGNVLPVLREMMSRPESKEFNFVVVANGEERPADLEDDERVIFVPRECDAYIRHLATAKWLITDNTFPPYFSRRAEQIYVNTWHGTPMKTLGKKIRSGQLDHRNAARNLLHVTHLASPNEFTARVLLEDNEVAHLFTGKVAVTGSPRNDDTISIISDHRAQQETLERLGLRGSDRKIIFFAPTWRGDLRNRLVDADQIANTLALISQHSNCQVLFRGHPMDEKSLSHLDLESVITVPPGVTTNEVLGVTDLLVSDYSSVVFDFAPTGRPIVLYAYDIEEYATSRGFSIAPDDVTDNVCRSEQELESAITAFASGGAAPNWNPDILGGIVEAEDGHSARRVVDFFFEEPSSDHRVLNFRGVRKKTEILFYQGSFMPNGITASFGALATFLGEGSLGVTVVLEPGAVYSDPQRVERFSDLDERARVLARVGQQQVTAEERWVIDRFNAVHRFESTEMEQVYWQGFAREAKRLFGGAVFDSAICFEGYARFWMGVIASASARSHGAYLHNDLIGEAKTRFPYLFAVVRQFSKFDVLASVSESVHETNKKQIPSITAVSADSFVTVPNLVNPERIRTLAHEPLRDDVANWISSQRYTFVNSARLSPEKGQAKLLCALKEIVDGGVDAELVIVGQGPLKSSLMAYRDELGLTDRVLFTDFIANPFPVISASDGLVMSSDYEGQGLVILEALSLQKPCVSTDVVGPRSILSGGFGLLVENNAHDLADGMSRMVNGWLPKKQFSFEAYVEAAQRSFADAFLKEK